ncbi:MAG: hypothetical protein J6A04_05980 [Clostridia bacterium]|nr:hypothetical protein [Clostridia bacterium]
MKKKLISSILVISILSSYIPIIPITTVSEAAVTTVWEYNYTGGTQSFTVPYKGIYQIEVFGGQRRKQWKLYRR